MESAKVFQSLSVKTTKNTIDVTVYASLPFWNRSGSAEFLATDALTLAPGVYDVRYVGPDSETTFLESVQIKA